MTAQSIPQKATDTHLLDVEIIKEPPPRLREYRCLARQCNRLLFRGFLPQGAEVEIRCSHCHRTRTFLGPTNGKERKVIVSVDQFGETIVSDVTDVNISIAQK